MEDQLYTAMKEADSSSASWEAEGGDVERWNVWWIPSLGTSPYSAPVKGTFEAMIFLLHPFTVWWDMLVRWWIIFFITGISRQCLHEICQPLVRHICLLLCVTAD